jgi:uncharacterized repeat protein (TIGR01451 family)
MRYSRAYTRFRICLVLIITGMMVCLLAQGTGHSAASALSTKAKPLAQSPSLSDLDPERESALRELYSQIEQGAPSSIEESQVLYRFIKGSPLSAMEADTVISRALYARYVTGSELSRKQKKLLKSYEKLVKERGGMIADLKVKQAGPLTQFSTESILRPGLGPNAVRNLPGFSADSLPRIDDNFSRNVLFSTAPSSFGPLNFFGTPYSDIWINLNGNVSFTSSFFGFTPFGLNGPTLVPIIAPFFADVDTRPAGSSQVTFGFDVVNGRPSLGINYVNVGYFNQHTDKLNNAQVILIDRSDIRAGDFDIEFNYDRILWETGDFDGGIGGLGGTSARIGFSNGTGDPGTFFELPGSGVNGAFLDSNTSTGLIHNSRNSGQSGRYIFQVRNGRVDTPNLTIDKVGSRTIVTAGSTITYTITVRNTGTAEASNVRVLDTLPPNAGFVSLNSPAGWARTTPPVGGPGTITLTKAAMAPNESAVFTLTVSVSCAAPNGSSIANVATVDTAAGENTPPSPGAASSSFTTTVNNPPIVINCPANIERPADANQCQTVVTYPSPTVTSGCSNVVAGLDCTPPSGSPFAIGTKTVNCSAVDFANRTVTCSFTVTVKDTQAPVLSNCPAPITRTADAGSCTAQVNLTAPTASDNCEGVTVGGTRSDGASLASPFPVGNTTISWIARDAAGNLSATPCTQTISVAAAPGGLEITPGNINLESVKLVSAAKKKKKVKPTVVTGSFTIKNTGCTGSSANVTFKAITRSTDKSKLKDANDSDFFSVIRCSDNGKPNPENLIGKTVAILAGDANAQCFTVLFNPSIPKVATCKDSTCLLAGDVAPDSFTSILSFEGTDKTVTFSAGVGKGVKLIDPTNPSSTTARVTLCQSGDEFTVKYHIYDSDKSDVKSVKYEFLDQSGNVVKVIDNVDLAGPISQSGLVNGQSFNVEQVFSGAKDNSNVSSVRVTVTASNSTASATSSGVSSNCSASILSFGESRSITILLPFGKLGGLQP